ncbi:hypothetical protein HNP55_001410 [Paucibacter oligotrophus]|uniref:Sporulation related protein n=1 Tax=Roseateles oligotrophus TaxID=1769250 RepID=A0A840L882_9BURK|nr:hypothetical protein [Roseateles oligotrophus]MBB4842895.1 hypothetical protein [Roseateles oligotrophus]
MLRALLLILIALNALLFGWTRGWLDEVLSFKARGDREPERVARQVNPEHVRLLTPQSLTQLQASEARSCLELPLVGDAALQAAQSLLARSGITPTDFQPQHSEEPGVWAVASIKLPNKDFQQRKEETYRKMKINFEYLQGMPDEMPSLILSRHGSEKAAANAMEALDRRQLKGLRVLTLQEPVKRHRLLVPQADGLLRAKLAQLSKDPALAPGFRPCPAAPAAEAASAPASTSLTPTVPASAAAATAVPAR